MKTGTCPTVPFGEGWVVIHEGEVGGAPGLVITRMREQAEYPSIVTKEQLETEIPFCALRFACKEAVEQFIETLTKLYLRYDAVMDEIDQQQEQPEGGEA